MDIGTALSVAQTLFAALQCSELKQICSFFGKESELVEFRDTVDTVKAVLLDAQDKVVVTNKHEAELYIQRLKDAVYDADDLLDEFVTIAEQKQIMKDGKVSEKLRNFFSRRNPFAAARRMSREVKKIKKTLDAIASDHSKFGFRVDSQLIRRRREETCSYVYERNIVGREDDVNKITTLLLDSNGQENVSFLSLVGMGGLGKTALAQLVFNDGRVTSAFPLRLWTCVSDHEQEDLDVEGILRKIWASVVGEKDEKTTLDSVQMQLHAKLASNRYLLILDDVWTEKRNQWQKMVDFLLGGEKGSWIVVTTRSHETAGRVGGGLTHELQGLSKEDSWLLFEMTAFGSEKSNPPDDLVKIGREIVEKCAGVPLAIRVAGSLLYGQDTTKWLAFQKIGLSNLRDSQKNVMPILKLSYDQLESPLKSCFTFCALFPKDSLIEKRLLISLWMAQSFIIPLDEGQTVDNAADEYFSILLRRCFFQDVERDHDGAVYSCKMHDLMHDLAQQIAGKEICTPNSVNDDVDGKVRHLAFVGAESTEHTFTKTHIRSCLFFSTRSYMQQHFLKALVGNWVCLRALDLGFMGLQSLPNSIGDLLHLRYLDLSSNFLEVLPESITKLYNMETLNLAGCRLKELPKELSKLVKMRILDLEGCKSLTHMPMGMGKLCWLHTLNRFVVNPSSWEQLFNVLEELKGLKHLKGRLHIIIKFPRNDPKIKQGYKREGGYLRNLEHLSFIDIEFQKFDGQIGEEALGLVEELQPHAKVKWFDLRGFNFEKESCGRGSNLKLPPHSNISRLALTCLSIEHVACLGNMPHLKSLELINLSKLEDIIVSSATSTANCELTTSMPGRLTMLDAKGLLLFPSLEVLKLMALPKMEGWRRSRMGVEPLVLPQLQILSITDCPNLESSLHCPVLEKLQLYRFNNKLQIIKALRKELGDEGGDATSSSSYFVIPNLKEIKIDDVKWLNSLSTQAFQCLTSLEIYGDKEVESLGDDGEVIFRSMTSLQSLSIEWCSELRSIAGVLEHLTSLEVLVIDSCKNLRLPEKERQGVNYISTPCPFLCRLTLHLLPEVVDLPDWMQFLTTLQTLDITFCYRLKSLPKWMPKLTSLQRLCIFFCSPNLTERCQDSTGEDWPLVKHIPDITLHGYDKEVLFSILAELSGFQ